MSISPALIMQQVSSSEDAVATARSPRTSAPVTAPVAISSPDTSSPEPAVSSPDSTSTDMRVDSQHHVYYAFVDDRSGNVLFEIPAEALREIAESLQVPLIGDTGGHSVDVKS